MTAHKFRARQLGCLLSFVGALGFAILAPCPVNAQQTAIERPDASALQNGDLIWPKNPKAIVPYDSGLETRREAVQKQWESERDTFVAQVRRDPASTSQARQLATDLEALSYADFTLRYLADAQKSDIEKYGGIDDILSVGHVGIVEVTADGQRFVIEAVWGAIKKVQRVPYADWLKGRADSWFWVGRLRDVSDATKQKFVEQSKLYLERPYNFWNFNLSDDSSFYCSKLVWLSYARSVGTSIDGRPPDRNFWFSPKQLWNLTNRIVRVNVPRDYSY
jgi:cell wall-associated NlpC family hydrolase